MKKSTPMWSLNDVRTSTWNKYIIGVDDSACINVILWQFLTFCDPIKIV